MAYASGSYSNQDNLVSTLLTWATGLTIPWTQDQYNASSNEAAMHINNVYVSMAWDETHIGLFQATGYTGGQSPGGHPNDSGSGGVGANDRKVENIGNGGGSYHFFSNFAAGEDYLYVALEYVSGLYRHFGFGELIKIGDWTGCEFCYGASWNQGSTSIYNPTDGGHNFLLDSQCNSPDEMATIRMVGFQNPPAGTSPMWGIIGNTTSKTTLDSNGAGRYPCFGGSRGGPYAAAFGVFTQSPLTGMIPAIPIPVYYRNNTPSPERWYKLGYMPYCRVISMKYIDAEEEFSVGGETWKAFPATRKQYTKVAGTEESWNMGVLYRKA